MDTWCQPVKPKDLRGILSPNWMDTHVSNRICSYVIFKMQWNHHFSLLK